MGRLFWKFFALFWLAQAATVLVLVLLLGLLTGSLTPPCEIPQPLEQSGASGLLSAGAHSVELPPLPLIAGVLVSLAFAAWLSWYLTRPIKILYRAFDALADGELKTRVGDQMGSRKDELAELGKAFDRSAAKLEAMVQSKQRLLHDVSHELRSPLTRLQAYGGLLIQQPERANELVLRIERETSRMDKLVGELLTLARIESTHRAPSQQVDLVELAHSLLSDAELDLQAKTCRLEIKAPERIEVKGNAEMLYRALDNVLRNAVRFSPLGGVIELNIAVDETNRLVFISIADAGPGLRREDIERIFEPFYRSQPHSDGVSDGHGLGLAITHSIVLSHNGDICAINRPSGGLEIIISLPL
jgi:two-component system, OmpR family, sensor kinase